MFVYQGAEAFRLWTGVEPPVEAMMGVVLEALGSANHPVAGMEPGRKLFNDLVYLTVRDPGLVVERHEKTDRPSPNFSTLPRSAQPETTFAFFQSHSCMRPYLVVVNVNLIDSLGRKSYQPQGLKAESPLWKAIARHADRMLAHFAPAPPFHQFHQQDQGNPKPHIRMNHPSKQRGIQVEDPIRLQADGPDGMSHLLDCQTLVGQSSGGQGPPLCRRF